MFDWACFMIFLFHYLKLFLNSPFVIQLDTFCLCFYDACHCVLTGCLLLLLVPPCCMLSSLNTHHLNSVSLTIFVLFLIFPYSPPQTDVRVGVLRQRQSVSTHSGEHFRRHFSPRLLPSSGQTRFQHGRQTLSSQRPAAHQLLLQTLHRRVFGQLGGRRQDSLHQSARRQVEGIRRQIDQSRRSSLVRMRRWQIVRWKTRHSGTLCVYLND